MFNYSENDFYIHLWNMLRFVFVNGGTLLSHMINYTQCVNPNNVCIQFGFIFFFLSFFFVFQYLINFCNLI